MARDIQVNVRANTNSAVADFEYLFDQITKGSRQAERIVNELLGGSVEQRVVLTIDADSGQAKAELKEILTEYDKIKNKINQVNKTQEGSLTSLRQTLNTLKQQRDATARYVYEIDRSGKSVRVVSNEWRTLDAQVKSVAREIQGISGINLGGLQLPNFQGLLSIGNKFTQVAAVVTAVVGTLEQLGQVIGAVVQRAGQVAQLELTFRSFGLSVDQSNQLINDAKAISLSYGGSLGAIEKGFRRLTPVITANGGTTQEVSDIIETLTARTVALGLNTDQSNRYIEAFAQVMGKGKLQAEELNQQFSELDGSLRSQIENYVRGAYGITDFDEAMKDGQITADIFKEALVAVSEEARVNLASSIGEIQTRIDELNPRQIQEISNTLNAISLENLSNTFAKTGQIFAALGVFVSQFFAKITSAFPNLNNFVDMLGRIIGGTIYVVLTAIATTIYVILAAVEFIFQVIRDIVVGTINFFKSIKVVNDAVTYLVNLWNSLPTAVKFLISPLGALTSETQKHNTALKEGENLYVASIDAIYNVEGQVKSKNAAVAAGLSLQERELLAQQQALTAQQELLSQEKERWELKKIAIEEEIQALQTRKDFETEAIQASIELQKENHEKRIAQLDIELDRLKQQKSEVQDRYALELAALDKKTPAEERLLELRRQELVAKTQNAELSERERLEAQASLDQLNRQAQAERLRAQQKEEEKKIQDQITAKEKEKAQATKENKDKVDDLNDALKATKKNYDEQIDALKQQITQQDAKLTKEQKILDAALKKLEKDKEAIGATEKLNNALSTTVDRTGQAADNAARLRDQLDKASKITVKTPQKFTGGPVSGGQTYTVNELGKEAFLSASGKLSMINTPSWGQWKAPSSGTIIPAHLASQLDIPKGGVNLNAIRPNMMGANGAQSINSSRSRVSSIGDRIINNITIQSENPVQTASDLMVNMVRQRRTKRY